MNPIVRLNIVLHEKQNDIHKNPARFKVSMLGGQFGKTELAIFDAIQACLGKKNGVYWYVCPTYGMAERIVWNRLKAAIPPQYLLRRPREDDLSVQFVSGSELSLKGADNYNSLRGVPLDGIIVDEAAFMNRETWEEVLRPRLMVRKGFAHFYSTPNGINWFTELHDDARRRAMAGDTEWAAFHFTSWDNPYIDRKELERSKEMMPDYKYNQEIMAIATENTGLRFPHFKFDVNIGKYEGNKVLTLYRGMDSGINKGHPSTCIWVEVDFETKDIYVTDEYGKSDLIIKEFAQNINNITGSRNVEYSVIDPSTASRNKQTNVRDIDEYNRYGLRVMPADNNRRGYDVVNMYLKTGKLKIHPKCKNLIYELSHVNWDDKLGDDYSDSLRYILLRIHDKVYGMNMAEMRLNGEEKPQDIRNGLTVDLVKKLANDYKNSKNIGFNDYNMNWVERDISLI